MILLKKGEYLWIRNFIAKYSVTPLDFDIMTKYISSKDLYSLIENYKITRIRTDKEIINHLVSCASNLTDSILKGQTYGYRDASIRILSNLLLLLLSKVDISETDKEEIALLIESLYSDSTFNKHFWNVAIADFKVIM